MTNNALDEPGKVGKPSWHIPEIVDRVRAAASWLRASHRFAAGSFGINPSAEETLM
jgi:hypothetical protein